MSGLPDVGPWVALLIAIAALALFSAHVKDASRSYRRWHDDRAALDGIVALTLTASTIGLLVAASAPFVDALGIWPRDIVRDTGFGITSGAMLATAATMFAIDRDWDGDRR